MSNLVVKRWARYGHDRLYVQAHDGTQLGYWDNKTNTGVFAEGVDRAAFHAALAAHHAGAAPADRAPGVPKRAPAVEPLAARPAGSEPPVEPSVEANTWAEPEWTDLAATKAGAAAREQALALKHAAPVKTFLARAFGVKTDERAWRIGADAEEEVAARLARLGDRWKVLHAVPVGERGADIDHVVIGPAGVFTINTKHHPEAAIWVNGNTFRVNGREVPYVRNSRFEAERTAKFLATALGGVPVCTTGVIAVVGARKGLKVTAQPYDGTVVVLTRREVASWLANRPHVIEDEQVEAIYAVARRSDTWRRSGHEKSARPRNRATGRYGLSCSSKSTELTAP